MNKEEQRNLAIKCGAKIPPGAYSKALTFYPPELAAYTAAVEIAVLEEVVRRAGESDTVLDLIEEVRDSK